MKHVVVAIDGPAASGKGTLARRLAERFGLAHLDTGRLYRATALLVLEAKGDPADPQAAEKAAQRVETGLLADPRLSDEEVARAASVIAAIPQVRAALLAFQRNFAASPPLPAPGLVPRGLVPEGLVPEGLVPEGLVPEGLVPKGAVLDGRDIGSLVCPDADVKLFLTASAEERARRRVEELRGRGLPAIYQTVLQDLTERDARDRSRRSAPLVAAPDAIVIDTTDLDAEAVFEIAAQRIARALAPPS